MKKFLAAILTTILLVTNTAVFNAPTAHAAWEWPKIELPHFELPHFEIPRFTIPGLNIEIDPALGFQGIKDIADKFQLPDKIDVPGTSFSIYPKESIGSNLVKNLAPFAGDLIGYLDPLKPIASAAKMILGWARPVIEPLIKKILPAPIKGAGFWVKEQIKNIVKSIDNWGVKDILLPLWDILVGPIDDLAMEIVDILAEEQIESSPGSNIGGGGHVTGGPPEVILPAPWVNQKPIGVIDNIDANGIVTGWAIDPDDRYASIKVRMHPILGQFQNTVEANLPRADVYPGNHGFSYRIPSGMRDGKDNILEAYGKDVSEWGVEALLGGSPKKYKLFEQAFGELTWVNKDIVTGWAIDPDSSGYAEVKFYVDGKNYIGSIMADQPYSYISEDKLKKAPNASKNIGFGFKIESEKYEDGETHKIDAYVVNRKDSGEVNEILLANSPMNFMFPVTLPVTLTSDYVTVQQGSRLFNTIIGVGNKSHSANVFIDGELFDVNNDKHGYPSYNYNKGLIVQNDGSTAKTRSADVSFKTEKDLSLGEHTITIESTNSDYFGFRYKGSFKINVVPYTPMTAIFPDEIKAETEFEVVLKNIPQNIKFSGKEKNAEVFSVYLWGDQGSSYTIPTIEENADGSISLHSSLPYEANMIRPDRGPINASVEVRFDNDLAKEDFRVSKEFGFNFTTGKTKADTDPIFIPTCKSGKQTTLNLKDGVGSSYGSATGLGCNQKITSVTVTGTKKGKPFSLSLPEGGWGVDISQSKSALLFFGSVTDWKGDIEQFGIGSGNIWNREYVDVGPVTITVKDAEGNTASATITIDTIYKVQIVPIEGDKIYLGDQVKILFKGFKTNGLSINVDGESLRSFRSNSDLNNYAEAAKTLSYDEFYIPTWMTPGEHKLALEDTSNLDAKGKVIARAETTFIIYKKGKDNTDNKTDTDNKTTMKEQTTPIVTVEPKSVKGGNNIQIHLENFSSLASVTIYLRPEASQESGGTKLSGYADYTDSNGGIEKSVQIPNGLKAGKYKILVNDIENLNASTDLTIEETPAPKQKPVIVKPTPEPVIEPTPEPTPEPAPEPVVEPTPKPIVEPAPTPKCPTGSTYSPTFKTCLEDEIPQSSPYEGLPCDENIPMYVQKGCVP